MGILKKKTTSKKENGAEETKTVSVSGKSDFAARVLLRPIVSEKSTHQEAEKKYSFFVAKNATKVDVKRAVKEVYGVLPTKVNMVVSEGKEKRFGAVMGRRNNHKKAIVTIPQDKNLAIHEGV